MIKKGRRIITTLFDISPRTDMGLPLTGEPPFEYVNRSAEPEIERIRNLLERWFRDYPATAQKDVRERFRSHNQDTHQHQSAFFELLVHALLRKLGCGVKAHPNIPGSSKQPDFHVCTEDRAFYLEATVIGRDRRDTAATSAEQHVLNNLNALESPYYRLTVSMSGYLEAFLKSSQITRPFKQWLEDHSPQGTPPVGFPGESVGEPVRIEHGDWELEGEFIRWPVDKPNTPYPAIEDPFVTAWGPSVPAHSPPIYEALKKKAHRYNPDLPLVIAISTSSDHLPHGRNYEAQALFGTGHIINHARTCTEDLKTPGLWVRESGDPNYTRVVATLIFHDAVIYRLKDQWCQVYLNPWSQENPLPKSLYLLPYATILNGEIQWHEGRSVTDLLETNKGSHTPGKTLWDEAAFLE